MKKYRNSVFIIVYYKGFFSRKYLLLKRKLHWKGWEFPKGGIENRESQLLAVRREIKEETSLPILKIKDLRIKGEFDYSKKLKDRVGIVGQKYFVYAVEVKKSKVEIDKLEHEDYKWVNFRNALKLLTWENQKDCLKYFESEFSKGL
jgi:8-oxo-dGTP pyrophosphatase MutT (NUDIX family)